MAWDYPSFRLEVELMLFRLRLGRNHCDVNRMKGSRKFANDVRAKNFLNSCAFRMTKQDLSHPVCLCVFYQLLSYISLESDRFDSQALCERKIVLENRGLLGGESALLHVNRRNLATKALAHPPALSQEP